MDPIAAAKIFQDAKIVFTILEQLSPGPLPDNIPLETLAPSVATQDRRERQKALAILARTSRSLSNVALDVLWRYVDDFRHTLFVFNAYDRTTHMFGDVITDAEWRKFQGYALRVRGLHLGEINRVHAAVWITLARLSPHEPLLPRLERLAGFTIDSSSPCYTSLFSPTVKHLELKVDQRAEAAAIRMVIFAAQPMLESLRGLYINDESQVSSGGQSQHVQFWTLAQLHVLHVAHEAVVSTAAIRSLASLSNLRSLSLRIKGVPQVPEADRTAGFLRLRDLSLSGSLDDVTAFLAATAPPNVETLTIDIPNVGHERRFKSKRAESLDTLYAALSSTLQRLRMTLVVPPTTSEYFFPEGGKLLAPICKLSGLRSIVFAFDNAGFHLSDAHLHALEDAWPDLVEFEIKSRERDNMIWAGRSGHSEPAKKTPHDHPTLKTLAAFAEHHPRLERLAVPSIDLDALPDLASVPFLAHGLRHIGLSTLEAGVPLFEYARVLDRLFPRLDVADARTVVLVAYGTRQPSDRADELRLLLAALQAGRESVNAHTPEARESEVGIERVAVSGMRLVSQGRAAQRSPYTTGLIPPPPAPWEGPPMPGFPRSFIIPPPPTHSESPIPRRPSPYDTYSDSEGGPSCEPPRVMFGH